MSAPPIAANSAEEMMTPDFTALRKNLLVSEAMKQIRALGKRGPLYYVYVTDEAGRLEGVLAMRDLVLADPNVMLESVMLKDVITVPLGADREVIVDLATRHHYLTIPVVDSARRLVGIIHSREVMKATEEEASEDIQKMFGAGGDEEATSPILFAVKKRLPWLYVNLLTAFLAAGVVGLFENTIARITVLAVFLPVVAGQGGNAGAQTLGVVIRGLALGEIEKKLVKRVIWKETCLGILNGVSVGIVTGLIGYLWHGNPYFGLVIGLAMIANMAVACVSGAGIPMAMRALGWDPAQSSSIILTTITDVVGFFSFLGLATLLAHLLI